MRRIVAVRAHVVVFAVALIAALAGVAAAAAAEPFPSRSVTIVVPYAPGAAPDTLARLVATRLAETFRQPVIVENRPGASGNVAGSYVARAQPDGHTILLATQPMIVINPALFRNLGYDPLHDLAPITVCANVVMALSVNPSLPVRDVATLVGYARAHPGLAYGTSGIGTPMHLAGLRLARREHVELTHVAYRGGAAVLNDLVAGNIQVAMVDVGSSKPFADAGKLRIVAVGEPKRFDGTPQIPTIAETLPGFELTSWFAFFGPGGMPPATVDAWNAALRDALDDPALKAKLYALGIVTRADGPAELARLMRVESDAFAREVRDNGITVE